MSRARKTARRRLTLADLQAHAVKKGGTCLARVYVNSRTPVEWSCGDAGHAPWFANASSVLGTRGLWCPTAAMRAGHWCRSCNDDRRSITTDGGTGDARLDAECVTRLLECQPLLFRKNWMQAAIRRISRQAVGAEVLLMHPNATVRRLALVGLGEFDATNAA